MENSRRGNYAKSVNADKTNLIEQVMNGDRLFDERYIDNLEGDNKSKADITEGQKSIRFRVSARLLERNSGFIWNLKKIDRWKLNPRKEKMRKRLGNILEQVKYKRTE